MRTLAAPCEFEEVIRKSRFLGFAARADHPDHALAFIDERSHPAAHHNCWAYRIGEAYRFHDDGEPASTAGRPILAAIEGAGLDHVVVLVVRYFGGIKLGAGGLVRAYGGCAARCLNAASVVTVVPRIRATLTAPFEALGIIHNLLDRHDVERRRECYQADGVALDLRVAEPALDALEEALANATRGEAQLRVTRTPGKDEA